MAISLRVKRTHQKTNQSSPEVTIIFKRSLTLCYILT